MSRKLREGALLRYRVLRLREKERGAESAAVTPKAYLHYHIHPETGQEAQLIFPSKNHRSSAFVSGSSHA
ncbi:hypothetical protein GOODEAATRI_008712, partial [Goodea atripinnis]